MGLDGSLGETDWVRRCGVEEGIEGDTDEGGEKVLCEGRNFAGNESCDDDMNVNAKGMLSCSNEDTGFDRSRTIGLTSVDSGC